MSKTPELLAFEAHYAKRPKYYFSRSNEPAIEEAFVNWLREGDKLLALAQVKRNPEKNHPVSSVPCRLQCRFLTLTLRVSSDPESKQESLLRSRISRIVSQRSYLIVQWCGVLAHTAKGMLHAHLVVVFSLKKLPSGKYDYPKPSWYQNQNQGDIVDIRPVNSLSGALCLRNYLNNQEHDTSESLIILGEHEKFFSYLEKEQCHLWESPASGGDVSSVRVLE